MEYRITKVQKYGKGVYQSEWIGTQYYNIVYARLYPNAKDKRHYYKVHFIHMFDGEELWEHYNYDDEEPIKNSFTKQDIKEYRDELIWAAAESIFYGNDIHEIIKECNRTIERYAYM